MAAVIGFHQQRLDSHRSAYRLSSAQPRLALAIAPAGFGKSTVIRQYAAAFAAPVTCDCMAVQSAAGFAQEVSAALALGDPGRSAELAQQRFSGLSDPANWSAFAMDSWIRPGENDLIVFENVEAIVDDMECVAFLARLLARAPAERRIAICSRRPLPFAWNRNFAPHEVVSLRSDDLRFEGAEIAHVFAPHKPSHAALKRIAEITRGWPIAIFLLARLARETSVDAVVERVGGIGFDGLYEYLADEVLDVMSAERFGRLLAVAAIPRASAAEVVAALDDPAALEDLADFARSSPFLYAIGDDRYEAHPLVKAMLADRYRSRCRTILQNAARALSDTNPLRAAHLYLAADCQDAAATLVAGLHEFFLGDPPDGFAEIVSHLDRDVIVRNAALWQAAHSIRAGAISQTQWLDEALAVAELLSPETPPTARVGVLSSLGNVLTNVGRHDEARAIFEGIARDYRDIPQGRALNRAFMAMIETRVGNFSRALEIWDDAIPLLIRSKLTYALGTVQSQSLIYRYRGERAMERARSEAAIAVACESRSAYGIARTLMAAAFGAWFAGEDDLFERYMRELEAAVAPHTARGTDVFRACARGDVTAISRTQGIEPAQIRCCAALIACGWASGADRAGLALAALAAAREAAEPMHVAIAAVACAESMSAQAPAFVEIARASVAAVDSEPLRAAIDAYATGSHRQGLLSAFVRRLRVSRPARVEPHRTALNVFLARASIERDGKAQRLTGRELELMLFLASHRRTCRAEEICDALWPQRDHSDRSVLRVYVRRVRLKLGDNAIAAVAGGYVLGVDSIVDLDTIEGLRLQAQSKGPIGGALRSRLEDCLECLTVGRSRVSEAWEWFAPVSARVYDLARELGMLLGRDALQNGSSDAALGYTQRIIELDPCDEPARELRIRAHLAANDRAAALRELRIYRNTLAAEHDVRISTALVALVGEEAR